MVPVRARAVGFAGAAVLAVTGVVGCDPGGLGTASVAYTTDQAATHEIEQHHVKVSWLNCTGRYGDGEDIVSVDCRGKTGDDRDITVKGKVARAVDGACVRGDLTATVGNKQLFRVSGLGDCASATPSPVKPPASRQPGRPAPTVTVTKTVWCPGDPACPVQGK